MSAYQSEPPSRDIFEPRVPLFASMHVPHSLRPLVDKLNRTAMRSCRGRSPPTGAPIKTERLSTPSIPSSSSSEQLALPLYPQPTTQTSQNGLIDQSSSSTSTATSSNSALSQALVNLLHQPPVADTTPILDFQGCRVQIHFHVHPTLRPAFPLPYSPTERLKRKRDGRDADHAGECDDVSQRRTKKIKLSHHHDSEPGLRIKG